MALQVNLTLSKTYFLPGEVVQVCVQISNDGESAKVDLDEAPKVVHVKELSFQAYGTERTDSSFIQRLHRQDVPADASDARRRIRSIFITESAVLINNQVLSLHAVKSFQLRFRLPAALPPSFRGSAVRFMYLIQVKAVYEVHRADLEAVVYETVASTSLMVWPSSTGCGGTSLASAASGGMAAVDRRLSSMESLGTSGAAAGSANSGAGGTTGKPAAGLPANGRELGRSPIDGVPGPGLEARVSTSGGAGSQQRPGGADKQPASPHAGFASAHGAMGLAPAQSSLGGAGGGGGHGAGGDEGDVVMCDYVLGRRCRIRWQEVRAGQYETHDTASGGSPEAVCGADGGEVPAGASGGKLLTTASSGGLASWSSFGSVAVNGAPLRGVIPFGINRPFAPMFAQHPADDSDPDEEEREEMPGAGASGGGGGGAEAASHVQRQLSSGTTAGGAGGGVGSLGPPFGRQFGRRGSLFGKVFALNMGEQPLLRVLLQAPLEMPLQPGATFGGVLDFRQPMLVPGAVSGPVSERPPMVCYDVAVLLESEEVISPECRPYSKRDGSGLPAGTPYVVRRLHAEHHELTADVALTSFTFSLPTSATPSFRTPMVALRWVLRFELSVGPRIDFAAMDKRARSPRPQCEQLVWSLPLVVRAPVSVPR